MSAEQKTQLEMSLILPEGWVINVNRREEAARLVSAEQQIQL